MGDGAFTVRYAASMRNVPRHRAYYLLKTPQGVVEIDTTRQGVHFAGRLGALRIHLGEHIWYVQLCQYGDIDPANTVLFWTATNYLSQTCRQMPPLPSRRDSAASDEPSHRY